MMNEPGFSTARARPFKEGPLTTVASVMVARSLTSPALTETVAAAAILSRSYRVLSEPFIVSHLESGGEKLRRGVGW